MREYRRQWVAQQAVPCTHEQAKRFIESHKGDIVKKVGNITAQMLYACLYEDISEKSVILAYVPKAVDTVMDRLQALLTCSQDDALQLA
jgi:hypothetical protein